MTWVRYVTDRRAARVTLLVTLVIACTQGSASASLGSLPCPGSPGFTCSTLPVPLDRANLGAGTISLSVVRKQTASAPSADAVLMLSGGPGQAAIPFATELPSQIGPALKTRDLLVMDQRGTGKSAPLACPAFEKSSKEPFSHLVEQCALQIGPVREAFTTAETVQDIEALRVAAGYQKLVLYGTSYGTKVALEYAERYPQNVESLVLDSVVPSNEEEPFQAPTFQAIGPVMNELCSHGGCAGITPDPIREIARLDARISRRSLKGAIYDGSGKRHAASLEPLELFNLLVAGDQNPILRTMLPGAVAAALKGDPSPLLRLQSLAEGVVPTLASESGREAGSEGGENGILYTDTTCEEEPLPWSRTAPAATRLEEARAAVRRLPPNTFYPFAPTTAYVSSDVALCASWPSAAPAPPPPSPLPNVPTLIFSGEQDLRTPTSGALSVAARIPDAQVLRVPFTGHSVIGSDLSSCSSKAIASFFGGSTVKPCAVLRRLPVTEVPPEGLAGVRPLRVLQGRPGRTVVATLDTLQDLVFTEDGAILENGFLPVGSSFGGLHGGYAKLVRRAVVLSNYSYVPGVFVSGTLRAHRKGSRASLTLSISGPQGADGTITLTPNRASGILGGRRFNVSDVGSRVASLSGGELPSEAQIQALADRTAPSRAETPRLPRSR